MKEIVVTRGAIVVVAFVVFMSGCARHLTSERMLGADIKAKHKVYVQQSPKDDSNIGGFIVHQLQRRGYQVTSGTGTPQTARTASVEMLVVYEDRWTWDMAPYLLTLRVDLRDLDTNVLLATGKSYRTSLIRKSPEKMVDEVLGAIFQDSKTTSGAAR